MNDSLVNTILPYVGIAADVVVFSIITLSTQSPHFLHAQEKQIRTCHAG